ncbi:hypothetical protein JOD55_000500 [Arcanobacterium pluranimalium]|nr:hypothetical protein [Arcanobacterium pluranimalium]
MISYIDAYKEQFGVEAICRVFSRTDRGEYGNGDERKRRLGANYAAVQARVNQKLGATPRTPAPAPAVNIDALADAVIRGEYGNGEARQVLVAVLDKTQAVTGALLLRVRLDKHRV